jgi:hypothetical protein
MQRFRYAPELVQKQDLALAVQAHNILKWGIGPVGEEGNLRRWPSQHRLLSHTPTKVIARFGSALRSRTK